LFGAWIDMYKEYKENKSNKIKEEDLSEEAIL
jgi:hypothetical protein